MMYSGDEIYDDEITSGPLRRGNPEPESVTEEYFCLCGHPLEDHEQTLAMADDLVAVNAPCQNASCPCAAFQEDH